MQKYVSSSFLSLATVPREFLEECFEVCTHTGKVKWKVRPRHHFRKQAKYLQFQGIFAGKPAGTINDGGYYRISVEYQGVSYRFQLHHLIWIWAGNTLDSELVIDHVDKDRGNNAISNLRQVTYSENSRNMKRRKDNKTGDTSIIKVGRKWGYTIAVDGKVYSKCAYLNKLDAIAAKLEQERLLGIIDPEDEKWVNSIGNL